MDIRECRPNNNILGHTIVDWGFIGGTDQSDVMTTWPAARGTYEQGKQPGARESGIFFIDDDNNLWIGLGKIWMNVNGPYLFSENDIWYFNQSNNKWSWNSGMKQAAAHTGVYPKQLDPSNVNGFMDILIPEAKIKPTQWHDRKRNLLFIFGGYSDYVVNSQIVESSKAVFSSIKQD